METPIETRGPNVASYTCAKPVKHGCEPDRGADSRANGGYLCGGQESSSGCSWEAWRIKGRQGAGQKADRTRKKQDCSQSCEGTLEGNKHVSFPFAAPQINSVVIIRVLP